MQKDDDVDRRRKNKRRFEIVLVLIGCIGIACAAIAFQQSSGVSRWEYAVAHADTGDDVPGDRFCTFKKSLEQFQEKHQALISTEPDGCSSGGVSTVTRSDAVVRLEQDIATIAYHSPIALMASLIAQQDRVVAAFLIGIAKQESDWGKHVPTKEGADCFNYWGYKGQGERGNVQGYACFASKEEAVRTVGDRLFTLVRIRHFDTPEKMLVWKCGNSCVGHTPDGVNRWVKTVDTYVRELK